MGEVFDLDAAYAAEVQEPFKFRWKGIQWQVPHLADLDWRMVSLADEMDLEAIQKVLLDGMGERAEEWQAVAQPTPAMTTLFDQWLEHSGMKPGEAPGSDDSSQSTAEPSQPTSTTTTGSPSAKPSSGRRKTASPSAS